MKGILRHLILTLRLNFRAKQALVYGYLVPIFFLIAFGSVFHSSVPPLLHEMGQLVTITILGGACFGMPTSMVSERERGVWRRYRLLPAATGGLIISAMVARYLIVLLAVIMQFCLAWCLYRTPFPAEPFQMWIAYTVVCFAFLGMGLVIAMLADAVPAVQALGQAIFLPMIMIGGVGVPLRILPLWAQHVAGYLPGRYAVEIFDACYLQGGGGLGRSGFEIVALLVIGSAACVAGAQMFRWDPGQRLQAGARRWIVLALAGWAAVGVSAEVSGRLAKPVISPAAVTEPWRDVTIDEINHVSFADLPPDYGVVAPVDKSLEEVPAGSRDRVSGIARLLWDWPPAQQGDLPQRLRNLLSAAAVADVLEDPDEGAIGYVVLDAAHRQAPDLELERALTYIIDHPGDGTVFTQAPELGIHGQITEPASRERTGMYAAKLLKRILAK
jgi:ABC-type multidrug transport system permease subunit